VCDFTVFKADGTVEIVDVKEMRANSYKAKKRIVEDIYGVTITGV